MKTGKIVYFSVWGPRAKDGAIAHVGDTVEIVMEDIIISSSHGGGKGVLIRLPGGQVVATLQSHIAIDPELKKGKGRKKRQ